MDMTLIWVDVEYSVRITAEAVVSLAHCESPLRDWGRDDAGDAADVHL